MPGEPVAHPSDGAFAVGRRGYDPQQVDAHLRRLDAEIRILVADRDAAVDQAAQLGRDLEEARLRADRLRTQVRTMAARPSDVQGMSERVRTMLRLAEDEVADMLRRADEEVARRLADADRTAEQLAGAARREAAQFHSLVRAEGDAILAEAARHREETDAACAVDRRVLADERTAAEHAIALAAERSQQECAAAWAESERRRATVEKDFAIAMDQRRAEALTAIQRERAQVARWVHDTRDEVARQVRSEITAAEETARHMIAEARGRVAELADVRGRIAAQLRGTQAQLGRALDDLAPEALPAPETSTVPAVAPAPRTTALPAAAAAPALPPAVAGSPEPVTRPFAEVTPTPAPPAAATTNGERPPAAAEPAPAVPGPRVTDDGPTAVDTDPRPADEPTAVDTPAPTAASGEPDPAEESAAEARGPAQRRARRQNSGSRR